MTVIWTAIKGVLSGLWGYVAIAGASLVAILAVYRSGKSSGANEVVVKSKEKEVENVGKAQEVERANATVKPSVKRERLRDKWSRD